MKKGIVVWSSYGTIHRRDNCELSQAAEAAKIAVNMASFKDGTVEANRPVYFADIETDLQSTHLTFNRQSNDILTGNIASNTMFGWYIRGRNLLKCNGFDFAPGELQASDLRIFDGSDAGRWVAKAARRHGYLDGDQSAIGYVFFTKVRGVQNYIGALLVSTQGVVLDSHCCNQTSKARSVLNIMRQKLSNDGLSNKRLVCERINGVLKVYDRDVASELAKLGEDHELVLMAA